LFICLEEDVNKIEQCLISYYKNIKMGYNLESGWVVHKSHSNETKAFMSELKKDKPLSTEHKKALSKNSFIKGKFGSLHPLSKGVVQLDINTKQIIKEYGSVSEASRETSVRTGGIIKVCKGKIVKEHGYEYIPQTAGGFQWRYK